MKRIEFFGDGGGLRLCQVYLVTFVVFFSFVDTKPGVASLLHILFSEMMSRLFRHNQEEDCDVLLLKYTRNCIHLLKQPVP